MYKPLRAAFAAVIFALLLGSCVRLPYSGGGPEDSQVAVPAGDTSTNVKVVTTANGTPLDHFALKLLRKLRNRHQNVLFSPVGIYCALAMLRDGSAAATRTAIDATLETRGLSNRQFDASIAPMIRSLRSPDPAIQCSIANALWADRSFTFQPDFIRGAARNFGAQANSLDLANGAPAINAWVYQKTNGEITDLVTPADLQKTQEKMLAVLTNAVYFHGKWTDRFNREATQQGRFTLEDKSTINVSMMSRSANFRYLETDTLQVTALPYGKGEFSFYVLLPKKGTTIDSVLGGLTPTKLNAAIAHLQSQQVELHLPTLDLKPGRLELRAALSSLGLGPAFSDNADFSRMGNPPVKVYQVLHKAILKVDEDGTTAAAATADDMASKMAPPPMPVMNINHPFLCAIRNDRTGALLFLAAIYNPTE